ncbi:uncharacterized protein LOC117205514 [Bombus bifarius]|uniref:Uncharacterized protein LOC117205514 n=1 Tax=Bombus bifarius TaxID=103933 RepID=A0A6P8LNK7_9HYME|nr:uncharacterized protein LOC117205514 [Bombus bifarius]
MLQEHFLTVLLGAAMSMTLSCSGFNPERSANIPTTWNVVSSLETEQKVTVDHVSSTKTEATGADKGLQISDTKLSTRTIDQTSPADTTREKRFGFAMENIESDTRFPKTKDANFVKEAVAMETISSSPPRNIVVIIADPGQNQEDFWKSFKASRLFSVEGMLQSCNNIQADKARFSLGDALIPGNRDKKHDCEHFLRSNIATLLLWTRDVKGMTTGTLSNANFTIPSLFGFEESVGFSRDFDEIDEINMKPEVRKAKPEIRGDWHVIDLGKPIDRVPPLMPPQNAREDDEAAWNVFDMFSKIRLVLFRSLLESLGRNVAASEDPISSRKSHLLRSNFVDMVEELKSVENEKGFILVASLSASELDSALEFLQREASQDTLLVVIGACPHDGKPVPFFAQGPSAKMIREAITIWDVPTAVKHVIANGCQDSGCRNRRHDANSPPVAQLKIIPHNVAVLRRTSRDTAKKSDDGNKAEVPSIKQNEVVKNVADLNTKNEVVKNVADLNVKEETVKTEERDASPESDMNSANFKIAEKFTTIFGVIVSLVGAFILTS